MRDYLAKFAILSQYSGVNYDNNYADLPEFGATRRQTSGDLPTDNVDYRNGKQAFYGACQTNPAYMGNPGEDR